LVDDVRVTATGRGELRQLGRFVVTRDGREIPAAEFGGRKVRALLRILATRRGSLVTHDALSEMLWGERPPADPAANLQVLVNRARRALAAPELLVTGAGGYALAGGDACAIDAEQFRAAVDRADRLTGRAALDAYVTALDGWGGEPLAEDVYADWAAGYRERLTRAHQHALEHAAVAALACGDAGRAVDYAARAAAAEPLREAAVLPLLRALVATGDPAAALERYGEFRAARADELGVDPSDDAQALYGEMLVGRGSTAHPARAAAHPTTNVGDIPFVGRSRHLDALQRAATGAEIALLPGESGAGKSRLLAQFARDTSVLLVRAYFAERDEPWSLARSLLREVLAADLDAASRLPASMRAALAWLVPESEVAESLPATDPESRRALLVEATVRLLGAALRPLVVDDVQWADATSIALLEAVLGRAEGTGVVLAYRPGEARERAAIAEFLSRVGSRGSVVDVAPLDTTEIADLVGDPALAGEVAAATDRTPLAVLEVLRGLAAEGAVTRTSHGTWRAASADAPRRAAELAAEGQRRAIGSRADAQPAQAQELLVMLALLAREVPARVLALAAGQDESNTLDHLGRLAEAGLARLGELGWATAHDMVGEVLAERLTADARGRVHSRLARALATAEPEPGELARHWLGAGDTANAAQAYAAAAERALAQFAAVEAAAFSDAGLAVVSSGGPAAALHEARAEARARLGDIDGARRDLRDALAVQPTGAVRARLLSRLATIASGAEDLVRAAELAELALVEAGADPAARAQALEIAAVLDMNLDRPQRAEVRAGEALRLYQGLADANGTARVLDGRAMATFLGGAIDNGIELLERAANLFEDSGDLLRVVTPRSTAGHGWVFAADPATGLLRTTSALELARTLGHPEGQSYALWHTAEALAALDRGAEALAAGEEALAIARQIAHRGWTATAWRAVGIAQQSLDDPEAALGAFTASAKSSTHLNLFASWAAARRALVLVELGRLAEAAPLVDLALAEGPPLGHYEGRWAQVELAAARGDTDVDRLAQNALRMADAAGMRQGRERLVRYVSGRG
jgi:DNA-binding SARP family transcriptional activator/tetratricopeptide (TPR) repeat protein